LWSARWATQFCRSAGAQRVSVMVCPVPQGANDRESKQLFVTIGKELLQAARGARCSYFAHLAENKDAKKTSGSQWRGNFRNQSKKPGLWSWNPSNFGWLEPEPEIWFWFRRYNLWKKRVIQMIHCFFSDFLNQIVLEPEPETSDIRSLKFEHLLHSPEKSTEGKRMWKLFTKQLVNWQKSRFKSVDTTYTVKQFLKNSRH